MEWRWVKWRWVKWRPFISERWFGGVWLQYCQLLVTWYHTSSNRNQAKALPALSHTEHRHPDAFSCTVMYSVADDSNSHFSSCLGKSQELLVLFHPMMLRLDMMAFGATSHQAASSGQWRLWWIWQESIESRDGQIPQILMLLTQLNKINRCCRIEVLLDFIRDYSLPVWINDPWSLAFWFGVRFSMESGSSSSNWLDIEESGLF